MLQVPEQISLAACEESILQQRKNMRRRKQRGNCCALTKITQPCDACSNGEEGGENLSLRKGEGKVVLNVCIFVFHY